MNHYVKYFLCLLCSIVFQISLQAQSSEENQKNTIIYQNNFDAYNHGDYLALVSPDWTTWTNNPGSAEDAQISGLISSSAPNSVKVEGSTDLIYNYGNLSTGAYLVEFDMFVPYGKAAYFNLQHVFAAEWALEVYFQSDLSTKIVAGGQEITNQTYSQNTWMHIAIEIDMNADWAKMYWDDDLVSAWQWSYDPGGQPGVNQLACANFYVGSEIGDVVEYFFDNFMFSEIAEGDDPPVAIVEDDDIIVNIVNNQISNTFFNIQNGGEQDLEFDVYPVYDIPEVNGATTHVVGYTGEHEDTGLGWGNGEHNAKCAVLLSPEYLSDYIGTELTAIEFFVNAEMIDLEIKVWEEGPIIEPGPQIEIYSKVHYPSVNSWNSVSIDEPIVIDGRPLYIGISYFQQEDLYCIGLDSGPRVEGVNFFSVTPGWYEVSVDYNLNIRGILTGDPVAAFIDIPNPSGTLVGGAQTDIGLSFNPDQVVLGTHTGQIVVASNDPVENYDYIDFSYTVEEEQVTTVSVMPENQFVNADAVFETTIEVKHINDLGGFEIDLDFNPAYLQANSVTLESFLGSTGRTVLPLVNNINNVNGLIEFAATTIGDQPSGPNGEGVLLTVEWTSANIAQAVNTDILIDHLQLSNTKGDAIQSEINNATIEIVTCFTFDFDCDCDVDIIDITKIAYEYGWECENGKSTPASGDVFLKSKLSGETLKVSPTEQTVGANEEFTTEIEILNISNLGGFELELAFDETYLQANEITLENFLGSTGRTVFPLNSNIDNTNGLIEYAVTTLGSSNPGPNGDGVLLTINWTSGSTSNDISIDLILQNVQIAEPDGTIIPIALQNGVVNINPCYEYDFDCDCDVDIIDITQAAYNYGWECGDKSESFMSFNNDLNQNVSLIHQESLEENEIKELHINIRNVHQFGAYELEYAFDPNVIEIISIEESDLLSQSGRKTLEVKSEVSADEARVRLAYTSLGSKLIGAEGSGELGKIIYEKRINSTEADFQLVKGQLVRIDAELIPFKSIYNIDDAGLAQLEIIPNPNNGVFTLDCQIDRSGSYSISLISSTGVALPIAKNKTFEKGYQRLQVSDMGLVPGIYLLKMQSDDQTLITKKMIVQ